MNEPKAKSFVFLIYLLLAASTAAVFWQVRNFDFVNYDDYEYVLENPHVLSGLTPSGIALAFTAPHVGNWLPLTWLSFMLDCQLFGPNPGWFHFVNLLLHIANTLLLFTVLKKMTGSLWPSAFVAAVFAIHPMHVESVAWITERKDILSAFFLLLTLGAYVSYVRRSSMFRYLLAVLLFAFGLMAKPMLVTLPFILLLLDYWPLKRFSTFNFRLPIEKNPKSKIQNLKFAQSFWHLIIEKIPFFALSAVSSVITFLAQRNIGAMSDISAVSLGDRVANAFLSYTRYMGRMFWPQNLAIFYPYDVDTFPFWQIGLCVLLVLFISVLVIRFGRKQRYFLVGWFWFVVILLPVIGLLQSGPQGWADRYTYISYIGLFIMIAWGLPELLSKWRCRDIAAGKIVLGISMLIVLAALGVYTRLQVSYWKDTPILFSRALAVTQNNYLAHYNFGSDLSRQGKYAPAIEHYKKAIQIKPYYADAILGLGDALAAQNDSNRAIECWQKTLQLKPGPDNAAHAHNNLGVILQEQGKLTEALAHFTKAIQLRPDSPIPMNGLAWFIATCPELKNSDVNEAIRLAGRACMITNYKNPSYLDTLAAAYASAGRFTEAVDTAQKAIILAETANQPQIKNIIQYHLTFYTQGIPYLESVQKPLPDPNKP
jgi:tetratricopeptide (TPR) repeat protein